MWNKKLAHNCIQIFELRNVDIFKSIFLNWIHVKGKTNWRNFLIHYKSIIKFQEDAYIENNGKFIFNYSRFNNNKEHGYLFLSHPLCQNSCRTGT